MSSYYTKFLKYVIIHYISKVELIYWVIAVVICVIIILCNIFRRKKLPYSIASGLLALYLLLIATVTILCREQANEYRLSLNLFVP